MNKMCRTPLQSATDMQKHMAVHNTCRAFAAVGHVMKQEPEIPLPRARKLKQ